MKVYLSPSQQEHNIGVGDYGSESRRCQDIASRAGKLLRAAGVTVKQTPKSWEPLSGTEWLAKVVKASNAYGADVHVCIHTNAGPGGADGTDAWHYPGSTRGARLTRVIYERVAPLSPGSDGGIHTSPVFYETRAAKAPVCYLELAFHTDSDDAESVAEDPELYAEAIAGGILEYGGIEAPAAAAAKAALVAKKDYPRLKQLVLRYALLNGVSMKGWERIGVCSEVWGEYARRGAWRVSGRLKAAGVTQTAKPTRELLRTLEG